MLSKTIPSKITRRCAQTFLSQFMRVFFFLLNRSYVSQKDINLQDGGETDLHNQNFSLVSMCIPLSPTRSTKKMIQSRPNPKATWTTSWPVQILCVEFKCEDLGEWREFKGGCRITKSGQMVCTSQHSTRKHINQEKHTMRTKGVKMRAIYDFRKLLKV